MNKKYVFEILIEEDYSKELREFKDKYEEFSEVLAELVTDDRELSAYSTFIIEKNSQIKIPYLDQIIKNDLLIENRSSDIKKIASRYLKRLALEENRVRKAEENKIDVYENSLNLMNDIYRRLNTNLKKINDSFSQGLIVDLPGLTKSLVIYQKTYTEGKKYDYKIN